MEITLGTKHEVSLTVTNEKTAAVMKSGSLEVFATPCMVALMEQAASELCDKFVENGITTVGTALNISHLAPTCIGGKVKAVATVTAFDGRKVSFDVEAYDDSGLIGKGSHERFTVKAESFMKKAMERKAVTNE